MTRPTHRVAIVGAGNITSTRHVPALRRSGRAEVVGVIDHRGDRAAAVAASLGLAHHGVSFDEPWLDGVDAVTIGTPPATHAAVATAALLAGKHVLLEKPMAMRPDEGERLAALAEQEGRTLAVVHNLQFARSTLHVRRLIERGHLGAITGALCFQTSTTERRLPVWHDDLPLGLFYDESPHFLYLVRALLGHDVQLESAAMTRRWSRRTPEVLTAHLRAGGVPVTFYNNFNAPVSEWHLGVYGTEACAVIDLFRDVTVVLRNDRQHRATDILRTTWTGTWQLWAGFVRSGARLTAGRLLYGNVEVMNRFLDAVEQRRAPIAIAAGDGIDVLRLQHDILEALGEPA